MDTKLRRVLEYDRIIELLKERAASDAGKRLAEKIRPLFDLREIAYRQAETSEAVEVLMKKGAMPIGPFYDTDGLVRMAGKGRVLTMRQLLEILYNLRLAASLKSFLGSDLPELPILKGIADAIEPCRLLAEEIDRCIISEDEMADSASPELRSIRRNIAKQNEALRAKLNQMVSSQANRIYLQDAVVTMREGRYVVPVKQEHRAHFPGIVHDQSASGQTLFIEPQAIVDMNNELRELELSERAEIERILEELSGRVASSGKLIINNQKLLLKLDIINAKGRLSCDMEGTEPELSDDGHSIFRRARHPLIDKKKAVPIELEIGGEYSTLVITGPNTGGKTVTLKTAGLLSMMAQAGLHIPAGSGSRISIYKKFFADIGDEQSIEQSLSTFSSHMMNIVEIEREADSESLVLLDELGAGTDPDEGAALAMAILEDLASRGAKVLATTHYTELKKYALKTEGVENASMQFDVETLSPTYRLTVGVPGKSKAFEIASKLGLDPAVTAAARGYLEKGDTLFEDMVGAIEQDRIKAEADRTEAEAINIKAKEKQGELDARLGSLEREKERILREARAEARRIVSEAKDTADEVRLELKELARLDSLGERNKAFDESRKKLREAEGRYSERLGETDGAAGSGESEGRPVEAGKLEIGARVKHRALGQTGDVLSLPDEKGELFCQFGALKMKVRLPDLLLIDDGSENRRLRSRAERRLYAPLRTEKLMNTGLSLNVQGQNLSDALLSVDRYLDDAILAGHSEVSIIHGRGEGILRSGIQESLRRHPYVASYRNGRADEGGDGVTIVKLKG